MRGVSSIGWDSVPVSLRTLATVRLGPWRGWFAGSDISSSLLAQRGHSHPQALPRSLEVLDNIVQKIPAPSGGSAEPRPQEVCAVPEKNSYPEVPPGALLSKHTLSLLTAPHPIEPSASPCPTPHIKRPPKNDDQLLCIKARRRRADKHQAFKLAIWKITSLQRGSFFQNTELRAAATPHRLRGQAPFFFVGGMGFGRGDLSHQRPGQRR